MKTIGRHLIAEYYRCRVDLLNDADALRQHLLTAAERIGATVLSHTFNTFSPHGVSGTVVIAESHLSIHTWPEHRYVAVDIFTCGGLDPRPGFAFLGEALGAESSRVQEILRGLPEHIESPESILPDDVMVITRMVDAAEFHARQPVAVD